MHIRQSISTRYRGATNHRGSRVFVESASGHHFEVEWDDALNSEENHAAGALALAKKLNWAGPWHVGATGRGYCFVLSEGPCFTLGPQI